MSESEDRVARLMKDDELAEARRRYAEWADAGRRRAQEEARRRARDEGFSWAMAAEPERLEQLLTVRLNPGQPGNRPVGGDLLEDVPANVDLIDFVEGAFAFYRAVYEDRPEEVNRFLKPSERPSTPPVASGGWKRP